MEFKFSIPEAFGIKLLYHTKISKRIELVQEALTLLNWMVEEKERGRVIVSCKPDGTEVEKLNRSWFNK